MRYPHARKGIAKLFASEVLQLIAVIFMTVCSVLVAVFSLYDGGPDEAKVGMLVLGLSVFALLSGLLFVISMLINLIGVIQTSKDEPSFKAVIYVIVVGIVASVSITIADFFITEDTGALSNFSQVVSDMVNSISTILIIQGISNIAAELKDETVCKKGQSLFHLIIWIALINISMRAVILCIPEKAAVEAEIILMLATSILSVIQYFVYLSFLRRASKMLKTQK